MSVDAISNSSGLAAMLAGQMVSGLPTAAQLAADRQALAVSTNSTSSSSASSTTEPVGSGMGLAKAATPSEIKKVASQFEAIILRQMLAPTIEPIMSGGSGGGSGAAGGGAGVYGYMVTDVLANSMSKGGGLGIASILEKQLSPKHPALTSSDNSQTTN